jgi:catechol-2,3-dioxygenase
VVRQHINVYPEGAVDVCGLASLLKESAADLSMGNQAPVGAAAGLVANSVRIAFVAVPVHNQQRAKQFWQQKLGFRCVSDAPVGAQNGQNWVELRSPDGDANLVLHTFDQHEAMVGLGPYMNMVRFHS